MRPRHKAAENPAGETDRLLQPLEASMRPRHKAAENPAGETDRLLQPLEASMRPRHKAAENFAPFVRQCICRSSFNEAAA